MNNTAKTAQQIAKQIAREPLEVLKNAESQVSGTSEVVTQNEKPQSRSMADQAKIVQNQNELQDKTKSVRRMDALNQELKDIHKHELFDDLQGKIAQGIEIPVADYTELSMEQKQVLKAQMEAVKNQMLKNQSQNENALVEPATRKGRQLFNFGKKTQVQREQTHVEKPIPPSG